MCVLLKITSFFFLTLGFLGESYGSEDIVEKPRTSRQRVAKKAPKDDLSKNASVGKKRVALKRDRSVSLYFEEEEISLERGKGGRETGGGKGGFYWWIDAGEKRAGKVYINWVDIEPIGKHASIQIFLNKQSQGKHIGRFAYAKACKASSYDEIYAHMRKNNVASCKSAQAAGFEIVNMPGVAQLLLKWSRKRR